ncbi:hypothetical protein [Prosthecobacter vanneervenii]|uniref:Uncharacterized protein n=1 Tax=Prosthecobacter vanneervenii TaxID=48466 RepID=A0A7W7YAP1_9BACT|nr:hypothetical protein [Prosthecobacter vanneervenii]MBB5032502.1 hypothetical protein [Prosthecobacter vanneervenii]
MSPGEPLRLTLFAVPKPFEGHIGCIQRNAVRSWRQLGEQVQILLFGDEHGTREMAQEVGAVHLPHIRYNQHGTPLLDGVFAEAHQHGTAPFLVYVNADIILLDDLWTTLEIVRQSAHQRFLIFGKRTDLDVTETIPMESAGWQQQLRLDAAQRGVLAYRGCKDYFLFSRLVYETIPAFAVGRGNWDNWMLHDAKLRKIPVIDVTGTLTAIHQNHGYSHTKGSRKMAYVTGAEARENERLAGGQNIVSGSTPTHTIRGRQIRRLSWMASRWLYWREIPQLFKLLKSFC